MIGIFSVLEVIKYQENFMEELYDLSEYKFTLMLIVTFPTLHVYLYVYIYIKHVYFATLMKYILEPPRTLFCEKVCQLIR